MISRENEEVESLAPANILILTFLMDPLQSMFLPLDRYNEEPTDRLVPKDLKHELAISQRDVGSASTNE